MTVVCRDPSAPHTVGSDYGGSYGGTTGARLYGQPGDRCRHPGCTAVLSAYNHHDRCACHGVGGKKRSPRRRGRASALCEAQTNAAPEPRRVTREELEMAAAKRHEASDAKRRVLAALTDEYDTAPRIALRAHVKEANAYYHLRRACEEGVAENKLGKGGGYRLRQGVANASLERMAAAADAMTEEDRAHYLDDEDAPAAQGEDIERRIVRLLVECRDLSSKEIAERLEMDPEAVAPHILALCRDHTIVLDRGRYWFETRWPTAPPAPLPAPALERSASAVGWYDTASSSDTAIGWFDAGKTEPPSEGTLIGYLEAMDDDAARDRVLAYAASRWPGNHEVVVRMDCAPSANELAAEVIRQVERNAALFVKGAGA